MDILIGVIAALVTFAFLIMSMDEPKKPKLKKKEKPSVDGMKYEKTKIFKVKKK